MRHACIPMILFVLINDAWWLALAGAGIALDLGIGANLDEAAG